MLTYKQHLIHKTASSLLHPFSLLAILLLLLNDHLLRWQWPSWLTGKLGDFAWLFFFPFVMLLLLAWLVPERLYQRGCRRQNTLPLAAFALVGGVFTLAKTIPICHKLLVRALELLLQTHVGLRRDPSDLVTLPALLGAWLLWQHAPRLPANRLHRAAFILPLCALLTVATSYDDRPVAVGQTLLGISDGRLMLCEQSPDVIIRIADTGDFHLLGNCYASVDSGESWKSFPIGEQGYPDLYAQEIVASERGAWRTITVSSEPPLLIRYRPESPIEASRDGGTTWKRERRAQPVSQVVQAYFRKRFPAAGRVTVVSGPKEAVDDPGSGNVVFNMGYTGILVRKPDGSYHAVGVGENVPNRLRFADLLETLLGAEFFLALALGGLGVATIACLYRRAIQSLVVAGLLWIAWGYIIFRVSPALMADVTGLYPGTLVIPLVGCVLLLAVDRFFYLGLFGRRVIWRLVGVLAIGALAFFLSLVLWAYNLLPNYQLAAGLGAALAAGLLGLGYFWARPADDDRSLMHELIAGLSEEARSRTTEKIGLLILALGFPVGFILFRFSTAIFFLPVIGYLVILIGVIAHGVKVNEEIEMVSARRRWVQKTPDSKKPDGL